MYDSYTPKELSISNIKYLNQEELIIISIYAKNKNLMEFKAIYSIPKFVL